MRFGLTAFTLILLISIVCAQSSSDTTEGGNITEADVKAANQTSHWAGIVGWLNGSFADTDFPVSFEPVNQSDIYTNEPNGSYADYHNYLLVVTRLPFKPDISDITFPTQSDFGEGGMFDSFTTFTALNTSALPDGPYNTFCPASCIYATCQVGGESIFCPFIVLNVNTPMAVLKFDNGTHEEPLFVGIIDSKVGFNGTYFDFEFIVPTYEDYYFYIYEITVPPVPPVTPPRPPRPPGGGPPGTPIYPGPITPPPPPPPPPISFDIITKNINITIDYPNEGKGRFMLTSNLDAENISGYVVSDYSQYTTVLIDEFLAANGTIAGTIIVSMSPEEILDYDRNTDGVLQCVGIINSEWVSTLPANVYLTINRPLFDVDDETIELAIGEEKEGTIAFYNIGPGNATAINISAEFTGAYSPLAEITDVTETLGNGQMGLASFTVRIPSDFEEGTYRIKLVIYENGRPLGEGYLILGVTMPPEIICIVPDLVWTLFILLLGVLLSFYVFRRKFKKNLEEMRPAEIKKAGWTIYKRPLAYALMTMVLFLIIWLLIVISLAECT